MPIVPPNAPESTEPISIVMLCEEGENLPEKHIAAVRITRKYINPFKEPYKSPARSNFLAIKILLKKTLTADVAKSNSPRSFSETLPQ